MDDFPIPPFWIAVVAILFLRWLIDRAQKAALRREEMRNQRRRGFQPTPPPRTAPSDTVRTSRPAERPRPAEEPRPAEPTRPSQTVPETLQELFEMRRRAIAEAQRAASKPPPLPKQAEVKGEVTEEETVKPEVQPLTVPPSLSLQPKRPRATGARQSIVADFADRDQIRKAVILKEVLDKPKGFDL